LARKAPYQLISMANKSGLWSKKSTPGSYNLGVAEQSLK
jgi:hypothetical protein